MQPIPLQRKVFCGHFDVLVLQSLLYLSRFGCPFLLPYISVAGSFLQFGFICDGPAVFSESEWVDTWPQANWPWLVYSMNVTYVGVSIYLHAPSRQKTVFFHV